MIARLGEIVALGQTPKTPRMLDLVRFRVINQRKRDPLFVGMLETCTPPCFDRGFSVHTEILEARFCDLIKDVFLSTQSFTELDLMLNLVWNHGCCSQTALKAQLQSSYNRVLNSASKE